MSKDNLTKQETLEEAADRESKLGEYDRSFESTRKNYFIAGAKWQQKRMYSEEEVKNIINSLIKDCYFMQEPNQDVSKWFEQFKKK